MKQARRVWRWAIERGEGRAWLYFIFGICQWLPVNHRTHYNESSGRGLERCFLCLTNTIEDATHLYQCPALAREHSEINMAATQVLRKWKIFGAECPIPTQRLKICKDWEDRARISPIFSTLHPGRLSFILEMYWGANHMKPNLSFRCFSMSLRRALTQMNTHLRTRPRFALPESLTSLMTNRFAIQIEANTNILHRSSLI